jgi:hypothetical protein
MLYEKKSNLVGLREWGSKVWVHDNSGSNLDGRSKIGHWIGFDEASNAHHIYWPDKCSVTVKQSVKFDDNDVLISCTLPIKGEIDSINRQPLKIQQLPLRQLTMSKIRTYLHQNPLKIFLTLTFNFPFKTTDKNIFDYCCHYLTISTQRLICTSGPN